jgi:hypothetical protein
MCSGAADDYLEYAVLLDGIDDVELEAQRLRQADLSPITAPEMPRSDLKLCSFARSLSMVGSTGRRQAKAPQ